MKTVIIGAGAAGLIAAGSVRGGQILVLERNEKTGKKLYITGKGRCNVTNLCETREFLDNVVTNSKFLLSAISNFSPHDTIALLENQGIPTKVERGNRVFPASDKSSDVIKAFTNYAKANGAEILLNTYVKSAYKNNDKFILNTNTGEIICDRLIIAAGGKSYPQTGSDGNGYSLAKSFSHTIIEPRPALNSLILKQDVSQMAGLTLKNVSARIHGDGFNKSIFGEMLFTHNGVSGPTVLSLSSYINRLDINKLTLEIDLKPALSDDVLDNRILNDFSMFKNKQFKNSLSELLPKSLISYIIEFSGIDPDKPVNIITKTERAALVNSLKRLSFKISDISGIESGIVTAGGVDVSGIFPKTMESRYIDGLFFAGEILDIDALTGGFNIQIAISTGYAAGKNAVKESEL